jgi:hypothetical protein
MPVLALLLIDSRARNSYAGIAAERHGRCL